MEELLIVLTTHKLLVKFVDMIFVQILR
jgi:hypothetical protein